MGSRKSAHAHTDTSSCDHPDHQMQYVAPSVISYRSYCDDNMDQLKGHATEWLQHLMDMGAILRDPPVPPSPKGKAAKAKAAAEKKAKNQGRKKGKKAPPEENDWMPGWLCFRGTKIGSRAIAKRVQPQIKYIERMVKGWRPDPPQKMGMPDDWFQDEIVIVLANNRPWDAEKYDREKVNRTRMALYVEPIGEHLERISTPNLIRRHLSSRLSQSILPDFCLPFHVTHQSEPKAGESDITISAALEKWLDIVNFPMGEHNVEITTAGIFTNIPQLWMIMEPKQRWLEPLQFEKPNLKIEFAMVREHVRPFTKEIVEAYREMPISYNNPALFMAMKGPVQWPDFVQKWDQPGHFDTPEWKELSDDDRLAWCRENLACGLQPSIDALIVAWALRVDQQAIPVKSEARKDYPLYPPAEEGEEVSQFLPDSDDEEPQPEKLEWNRPPEWFWIPGMLFDYDMCYLVAHIPLLPEDRKSSVPTEYISWIFDEIPILRPASGDSDDRDCLVERVRMGLAWFALMKQAQRVASMWDALIQPDEILRYEELVGYDEVPDAIPSYPIGKRDPTRLANAGKNKYRRKRPCDSDEESLHHYQNQDIDSALSGGERDRAQWEGRFEEYVPRLREGVEAKIMKWRTGVESPTWTQASFSDDDEMSDVEMLVSGSSSLTPFSERECKAVSPTKMPYCNRIDHVFLLRMESTTTMEKSEHGPAAHFGPDLTAFSRRLKLLAFIAVSSIWALTCLLGDYMCSDDKMTSSFEHLADHCRNAVPIQSEEFHARQDALATRLFDMGAAAYIAEPGSNALYLANLSTSQWWLSERPLLLVVTPRVEEEGSTNGVKAHISIIAPAFEGSRASLMAIPSAGNVTFHTWAETEDPYEVVKRALPNATSSHQILVDEGSRYFVVNGLQRSLPEFNFQISPQEIRTFRERKSANELALMRCANEVTLLALREVRRHLRVGIAESEARVLIRQALKSAGLENGDALVLFGENAALPHGSGSDKRLGEEDLALFDMSGTLHGYWADLTRTIALPESKISPANLHIWYTVRAAQATAMRVAKAGVAASVVDGAARRLIDKAGFGDDFSHRLGHGIGVEVHESPYLHGGNDQPLATFNTFSNEPGVYQEGKIGVRLEDCFYIDEEGNAAYLTAGVGGQAISPWMP